MNLDVQHDPLSLTSRRVPSAYSVLAPSRNTSFTGRPIQASGVGVSSPTRLLPSALYRWPARVDGTGAAPGRGKSSASVRSSATFVCRPTAISLTLSRSRIVFPPRRSNLYGASLSSLSIASAAAGRSVRDARAAPGGLCYASPPSGTSAIARPGPPEEPEILSGRKTK